MASNHAALAWARAIYPKEGFNIECKRKFGGGYHGEAAAMYQSWSAPGVRSSSVGLKGGSQSVVCAACSAKESATPDLDLTDVRQSFHERAGELGYAQRPGNKGDKGFSLKTLQNKPAGNAGNTDDHAQTFAWSKTPTPLRVQLQRRSNSSSAEVQRRKASPAPRIPLHQAPPLACSNVAPSIEASGIETSDTSSAKCSQKPAEPPKAPLFESIVSTNMLEGSTTSQSQTIAKCFQKPAEPPKAPQLESTVSTNMLEGLTTSQSQTIAKESPKLPTASPGLPKDHPRDAKESPRLCRPKESPRPVKLQSFSMVQKEWESRLAGTGEWGRAVAGDLAGASSQKRGAKSNDPSGEATGSAAQRVPTVFKTLERTTVRFTDRHTGDSVEFACDKKGNRLSVCVNGNFRKTIEVLRLDEVSGRRAIDQDDWDAHFPEGCASQIAAKLRTLAKRAGGVPVLEVVAGAPGKPSDTQGRVVKGASCATLSMPPGAGVLQLHWAGAGGELHEELRLWHAGYTAGMPFRGAVLSEVSWAAPALRRVSKWVAARGVEVLVVIDAGSLEGQILAAEVWPALRPPRRRAVLAVSTSDTSSDLGGAAAAFSTASVVACVFAEEKDPVAIVEREAWISSGGSPLQILREILSRSPANTCIHLPESARRGLQSQLDLIASVYKASRAYIHGFVGAGAMEADVSDAIEKAVEVLRKRPIDDRKQGAICAAEDTMLRARVPVDSPNVMPSVAESKKALVSVGHAGRGLVKIMKHTFGMGRWHEECAGASERFVVIDASDPSSEAWLQAQSSEYASSQPMSCLVLLPEDGTPRTAWETAAKTIQVLVEESGASMSIVATIADQLREGLLVELLASLGEVPSLADIAFQLLPYPRTPLFVPVVPDSHERFSLTGLTGTPVHEGEVLACYSIWSTPGQALANRFLRMDLHESLACAGHRLKRSFASLASKVSRTDNAPIEFHLCSHGPSEIAVLRRAAGDFVGRGTFSRTMPKEEEDKDASSWAWAAASELRDGLKRLLPTDQSHNPLDDDCSENGDASWQEGDCERNESLQDDNAEDPYSEDSFAEESGSDA